MLFLIVTKEKLIGNYGKNKNINKPNIKQG